MKKAEIARLFKICFVVFTAAICGSDNDNDCEDSPQEMIPVGGKLSFEVHLRDVAHYGITIYHGKMMFVDINEPGISHFPNQANEERTLINKTRYVVHIQIGRLILQDGGKYVIKGRQLQNDTYCRLVYITDYPVVRVETKPIGRKWFETGSDLALKCIAESTTYPNGHNLDMHLTWIMNRTTQEERDTVFVLEKVTQADNGTVIACQAKEGGDGEISTSDFLVIVHWGPKDVKFHPPKDLYKVSPGTLLPNINGTADCFPPCSFKWTKDGIELSDNGVLSLGTVEQTSEGVYILTAWREESSDSQTKSLTVILKVAIEPKNSKALHIGLTVTGGGIIFAVCVLAVIWNRKTLIGYFRCCKRKRETNRLNQTGTHLIDSEAGTSSCTPSKDNIQNEKVEKKTQEMETYENNENDSDVNGVRRNLMQQLDSSAEEYSDSEN